MASKNPMPENVVYIVWSDGINSLFLLSNIKLMNRPIVVHI